MIEIVTWMSVIVLGPGSAAIFVWFLYDLRKILGRDEAPEEQGEHESIR